MAVTLEDPTLSRDPSTSHAIRDADPARFRAPRTLAEELLARFHEGVTAPITFELASHGGYARTLTGTIDYVDDEAQTLMVVASDGSTVRVPLRDVTSAREHRRIATGEGHAGRDLQGLGTGAEARRVVITI